MAYGSLQAKIMKPKHNGHIHSFGTPFSVKILVYVYETITSDNQMSWMLKNIARFDMPKVLFTFKAGLL